MSSAGWEELKFLILNSYGSVICKTLKLGCLFISIREFCDLSMPILMFDKDENYCVLRLEEVSVLYSPVRVGRVTDHTSSYFPCLSVRSIWIAQETLRSTRELP